MFVSTDEFLVETGDLETVESAHVLPVVHVVQVATCMYMHGEGTCGHRGKHLGGGRGYMQKHLLMGRSKLLT